MSRTSRRCEPVPMEVRETADLLERRWQLSIIYAALSGALRFNEFAQAVAGISPRMLAERPRAVSRYSTVGGLEGMTVRCTSPALTRARRAPHARAELRPRQPPPY